MMMKKAALGKGLGALISDANEMAFTKQVKNETPATPASIAGIPVNKIIANPYQPRTTFDETLLNELAESIKTMGVIQPITVRETEDGHYQIISGERRYRASVLAGLEVLPAYIRKANDQEMLEMAIVENVQRSDLNSIEVALGFHRLIEECKLTQEEMADRVGKKRSTITNYLRLLKLPVEIQLAIKADKISMGHARALLAVENKKSQLSLCNKIIEKGLSVREVEAQVQKLTSEKQSKSIETSGEQDESYLRVVEILGKYARNNVSIKRSDKGESTVTIRFRGDEEFGEFLNALENNNL
jgi:ParB family chromosome partitioning protein